MAPNRDLNDRSGSKTVLTPLKWDVCITPESRHRLPDRPCPKSAITGLMHCSIAASLDHLIGASVQKSATLFMWGQKNSTPITRPFRHETLQRLPWSARENLS
jgi:hypothetical protein